MKYVIHTTQKADGRPGAMECRTAGFDSYAEAQGEFVRCVMLGVYSSAKLCYERYDHPLCFGADWDNVIEEWSRDEKNDEKRWRLERDGEYLYDTVARKFIEPGEVGLTCVEHVKCSK